MAISFTTSARIPKPGVGDAGPGYATTLRSAFDAIDALAPVGALAVAAAETPSTTLNVRVAAGTFRDASGASVSYAGTSSFACTTAATNSVYLTNGGVLSKSTSGYPGGTIVRLATVVAGATTITSVTDDRQPFAATGLGGVLLLGRTATATAFNASSAEQTIYSIAVAGNTLGASGALRISAFGDLLANSGTPTLTLRVKLGATTLWGDASAAFAASAVRCPWRLDLVLANAGATNAQVLGGSSSAGSVATASVAGLGDIAAAARWATPVYGSAAIDTTASATLAITAQWSVSDAAVEITRKWASVELMA